MSCRIEFNLTECECESRMDEYLKNKATCIDIQ